MSEPVVPERMDCGVPDGTIFECQKPGLLVRLKQAEDENWVYRQSVIWPPDYERLQAKVAEHEATHTAMLDDLRARLKESEELSWKNWRGREEAYAEMRVCRTERDDAVNMIREQAISLAIFTELLQEALSVRFVDHVWCLRAESALSKQEPAAAKEGE